MMPTLIPKIVIAADLEHFGACRIELMRFKELFPDGMAVAIPNLERCLRRDLDVFWALDCFDGDASDRFWDSPAGKSYREDCAAVDRAVTKACSLIVGAVGPLISPRDLRVMGAVARMRSSAWKVPHEFRRNLLKKRAEELATAIHKAIYGPHDEEEGGNAR